MESWKIRDEILRSVHQWYFVLTFLVVGGLLGYLVSYLIPSPYRATADIYVGIDVVRVNEMEYIIPLAEEEPLNLDDYKNWQLKQVSDILTSNWVVEKTLSNLKQKDPFWDEISQQELREAMDIYWYDSGTWRMELILPEKDQAEVGVQTWINTGHDQISKLLDISTQAAELDAKLWSINLAISKNKQSRAYLKAFQSSANEWIAKLSSLALDQPLENDLLTELNNWIQFYTNEDAAWGISSESVPESSQSVETYITWLDNNQSEVDMILEELAVVITILEEERADLLPAYHQSLDDSLGLSANLVLLPNTSGISTNPVRSTDILSLGGAFLGLLAWILFAALRIGTLRKDNG